MADLKQIIHLTQEGLKREVPTEQAVLAALDQLKPREADVIKRRYGLLGGEPETLQDIGQRFSVTRERVRQIETAGLKKLSVLLQQPPLATIIQLAQELVRMHGGVMEQSRLVAEFLPAAQQTTAGQHTLLFLLKQSPGLHAAAAEGQTAAFFAISAAHRHAVGQVLPILADTVASAKQPVTAAALLPSISNDPRSDGVHYLLTTDFLDSTLAISTAFVETPDNAWGLASWPEINPRNIHDKTLYVLRQAGTPLHFTEITKRIAAARFDHKHVTTQAVHNELINGDEFVLVGRGIYALAEWGYLPGTVADVIKAILAKARGPLDREEIIDQVLKQRHVSRSTIIINLQEKSLFKRQGQAYSLVP